MEFLFSSVRPLEFLTALLASAVALGVLESLKRLRARRQLVNLQEELIAEIRASYSPDVSGSNPKDAARARIAADGGVAGRRLLRTGNFEMTGEHFHWVSDFEVRSEEVPAAAVVSGATYTPTATSNSNLTVAITVDATASAVCSISGGVVSFLTVGTCVLDFNQAGNSIYSPATQVQQSFLVGKGSQTITVTSTAPAAAVVAGATYTPTATATSSLSVAITSATTAVCTISGGVVSFLTVGTCTLNFNQAGNTNWNAATQVQQSFTVAKATQTITTTSTAPSSAVVIASAASASGTPLRWLPSRIRNETAPAAMSSLA